MREKTNDVKCYTYSSVHCHSGSGYQVIFLHLTQLNPHTFQKHSNICITFSLHCHCVSRAQIPVPLYFHTMLTIHYKDTGKWSSEL